MRIEQGLNKNVPGMYYFDKLPARIKIKNGKVSIFYNMVPVKVLYILKSRKITTTRC